MKYLLLLLSALALFANEDLNLIKEAYNNGLKPVPSNFESLLKALNTDKKSLSKDKISLGKKLFFEKDLSLNKDISCATCHSFNKGGADAIPTAIGDKNQENPFHLNTPTVLNTAFSKKLFWNGSSESLAHQATGPLQAPFEMAITPKLAEKRIKEKEGYEKLFNNVYGEDSITFKNIANAIAAYEKTLITHGRFDQYLLGDYNALTKKEKNGLKLFIDKGCVGCHNSEGLGGQVLRKFPLTYHDIWSLAKPKEIQALQNKYTKFIKKLNQKNIKSSIIKSKALHNNFSSQEIHLLEKGFFNTISKEIQKNIITSTSCNECHTDNRYEIKQELLSTISFPFENIGGFLGAKNTNKYFRVPLLRNIVQTKPYFHNGSIEKLEDAIKLMARHQSRANITDSEIEKIISFLKAVDGELIQYK